MLVVILALAGCGHAANTSTNSTATTTTTTTTTVASSDLPADCQAYLARIDELATRMGGAAAAQYHQTMAASRQQWESMPDKEAAAPACRQALAALEQQSAIMNQMGQH